MKKINIINVCYFISGLITVFSIESLFDYIPEFTFKIPSRNFFLYVMIVILILLSLYHKITKKHPETKNGLRFLFILLTLLSLLMYMIYINDAVKDYQTIISIVFSSILVASGWWVQDIISRTAMRRSHTLNVVMNQRNSETFTSKIINCRDVIGFDKILNEEVIKYYLTRDNSCLKANAKDNQDLFCKFEKVMLSLDSMAYIINYYEFIAAGVINKDLDSDLLRKCYSGIVLELEKRAFWLIYHIAKDNYSKQSTDFAYYNLLNWIKDMSKNNESIVLNKLDNPSQSQPSGKFVFSKEEIDTLFN